MTDTARRAARVLPAILLAFGVSTAQPQMPDVASLAVVSPGTVVAVGSGGSVLRTTDGGRSWTALHIPGLSPSQRGVNLFDVSFPDRTTGYISGDRGLILRSSDGGLTWDTAHSPAPIALRSLDFVTALKGWCVGDRGAVYATSDGGGSWSKQKNRIDNNLWSVDFCSPAVGVTVGSKGMILRTTDGGASWSERAAGVTSFLYAVGFADTSRAWAVGGYGTVLHSSDGGSTWAKQNLAPGMTVFENPMAFFHHVSVGASGLGVITGISGDAMRTTDSGAGWEKTADLPEEHFYCAALESDSTFWIAGRKSLIFKSTDGGSAWVKTHPPE